jgi:hypothetical protein
VNIKGNEMCLLISLLKLKKEMRKYGGALCYEALEERDKIYFNILA